jgi:hypothetical protein
VGCQAANNDSAQTATPTPTPDNPATRAARDERDFQGGDVIATREDGQDRTDARLAVTAYVNQNLPGWNIKGMSSQVYPGLVFSIDADLEKSGKRVVVTFDTRKFFPDTGEAYWLPVPVNKYRLDRLHELSDMEILEDLKDAKDQIRAGPEQP